MRLPIIMVTAKSSELDTVRGLDCGADDYISKPFGIMEFLSRVRASLRRAAPETRPNVLSFHEILLDNARHSVTVNNQPVELTYKEYSLLRLLLENTNLVVTRETILQVVWGTDISVESRTVDMHIRTLRKKLGDAGRYICTIRKVGYKLADRVSVCFCLPPFAGRAEGASMGPGTPPVTRAGYSCRTASPTPQGPG